MKPWWVLSALVVTAFLMAPLATAPKPPGAGPKPPPAPADPVVAYTSLKGDVWSLGVMNADGSAATTVYNNTKKVENPTWAADRSAIAFTVGYVGSGDPYELWRVDVNVANGAVSGADPLLLHTIFTPFNPDYYTEVSPAWSPDGTVIAFPDQDIDPWLYHPIMKLLRTIPATGGTPTTLYTAEDTYGISEPTWSHDGTEIAWVSTRFIEPDTEEYFPIPVDYSIMVLDIPTNTTRTVFGPVTYRVDDLDWARTQDTIAFYTYSPVSGIYTVDLSQPDPVPQLVVAGDDSPTWLPNDAKIAFVASQTTQVRKRQVTVRGVWTYEFSTGQQAFVGPGSQPDWARCDPCP